MKYLPTAYAQLQFVWKLYNYVLEGKIKLEDLDTPITFTENNMILPLQGKIFDSESDMILAFENNLTITFGAAAITLNRAREEAKMTVPITIESQIDQFIALVYQIRNAFAHDIAEPKWNITNDRYLREYKIENIHVDLRSMNGKPFDYKHIGGPETLLNLIEYGQKIWTMSEPTPAAPTTARSGHTPGGRCR